MYCKTCGTQLPKESRFCPSCGKSVKGGNGEKPKNQVARTITKSFGHGLLFHMDESELPDINNFLSSNNFGNVHWSLSLSKGRVSGVTFTCEEMVEPVPYVFQAEILRATGSNLFGWLSAAVVGWNPEDALNKWISENKHKKIRNSRVINDYGKPTQAYILYTVRKT